MKDYCHENMRFYLFLSKMYLLFSPKNWKEQVRLTGATRLTKALIKANEISCYKAEENVGQLSRALDKSEPYKYSWIRGAPLFSQHMRGSTTLLWFYWAAAIAFSFPRKSVEQLLCADSETLPSYFWSCRQTRYLCCVLAKNCVLFQRLWNVVCRLPV